MKTLSIKLVLGVALLVALAGCGTPKWLVDQQFLGDKRTVKVILLPNNGGYFDQYVRVCSLSENGAESQCKDTLILSNVTGIIQ